MMEMKRNRLEPNRYDYLSEEDSELYDRAVLSSDDLWPRIVVDMLEAKAKASRGAHMRSSY